MKKVESNSSSGDSNHLALARLQGAAWTFCALSLVELGTFPSAMVVSLEVGRPQPGPMFEATTLNGLRLRTKPEDFEIWRESLPDLQEPLVDVGRSI